MPNDSYTSSLNRVIELAKTEACNHRSEYVEPEHLLLSLLELPINNDTNVGSHLLIRTMGIDKKGLVSEIEGYLKNEDSEVTEPRLSERSDSVLDFAKEFAMKRRDERVDTCHLVYGLITANGSLAAASLSNRGVTRDTYIPSFAGLHGSGKREN
jgi:ATP-dependent Clp protease ATP-binding subunit ClpA